MNGSSMDCIALSDGALLMAAADGRCWMTAIGSSIVNALPVSAIAAQRATLAASAIEGAIVAGLTADGRATARPPYTLSRYVRWLAGNCVFAAQTPGFFRRAADRFIALGRRDLARVCLKKAAEEAGHARLALRDLAALGLEAAEVVRLVQPPSAMVFVQRFRQYVDSSEPITLFGFSYCLERMAIERDESFILQVAALCPPGIDALRFLKVHSVAGSDNTHVYEQLTLFESLQADELRTVVRGAYETARLLAQQPSMDSHLSDEEINRRLRIRA